MDTPTETRETPRRTATRFLLVLASVLLVAAGLGMTCRQWLDLPGSGNASQAVAMGYYGDPIQGFEVKYKGHVTYDQFWLGGIHPNLGHLKDADLWELNSAQMRVGGKDPDNSPFTWLMGVKLDVYEFDRDTEDWYRELANVWGATLIGSTKARNLPCGSKPTAPFIPAADWTVICGKANLQGATRTPYGVLKTSFNGLNGAWCYQNCTNNWTHRIP